jgi:Family of unknown function (DUF5681)
MAKRQTRHRATSQNPARSNRGAAAGDYKVGYRRPPRHTRFEKGRSGNPNGRPQGAANAKTIVSRAINERVRIREGETERAMTKLEAMLQGHLVKAIKGDARSAGLVINLVTRLGLLAETENKTFIALSEEDHAILDDYVRSKTAPAERKPANKVEN